MRQSVLASVLDVAAANLQHTRRRAPVRDRPCLPAAAGRRSCPTNRGGWRSCCAAGGSRSSGARPDKLRRPPLDFFDLKGVVEALVEDLHLPSVAYRPVVGRLSASRQGGGTGGGRTVGRVFRRIAPEDRAEAFGLAGRPVLVGEFDLEALQAATPARLGYAPVPRFPAALRDVAVIVPEATPAERVEARDPGRRRRPVARRAAVRPVPRREHRRRREEPGLRPDVPGRRPHADRQGSGPGAQEDRGPSQACPQGTHPRARKKYGCGVPKLRLGAG